MFPSQICQQRRLPFSNIAGLLLRYLYIFSFFLGEMIKLRRRVEESLGRKRGRISKGIRRMKNSVG